MCPFPKGKGKGGKPANTLGSNGEETQDVTSLDFWCSGLDVMDKTEEESEIPGLEDPEDEHEDHDHDDEDEDDDTPDHEGNDWLWKVVESKRKGITLKQNCKF